MRDGYFNPASGELPFVDCPGLFSILATALNNMRKCHHAVVTGLLPCRPM
jgi:hypothetical protein